MLFRRLAGSTALVLSVAAPAYAEVTPEQVWENWQALAQSSGQTITTQSVERDGDALVISGLTLEFAQEGASGSGQIDEVRFTDQGDGTVRITMSDDYPINMTVEDPEGTGEATALAIQVSQPGIAIVASGSDSETAYDFTAPEVTVALTSIEGPETETVDATAQVVVSGVTGKYLVVPGEGESSALNSSFAADGLAMTIDMADAAGASGAAEGGPSSMKINISMSDLAGTTNGNFLSPAAMADMAAALQAGFASDAEISTGPITYEMIVTEASGVTTIAGKAESNTLGFALDAESLGYAVGTKGAEVSLSGPEIPFPQITLSYAEAGFDFLMPVAPGDAPSDFSLVTRIVDLAIPAEIWGMFDPGGQLPRDPATVVIDTAGTATLTANLMDPAAMEALGEQPPGELNSLDIRELRAKVAGADLTGAGSFVFDNTDLVTFGGFPAPTGKLDLKLSGGNTLMDRLVTLGFLPEDQAMGFRMMLSMFANVTGEDELSSTLEFRDGGFFANGQRLQ